MANPTQVRRLREGVKAWNTWRNDHPAQDTDLTAADLRRAYLSLAILNGADLSGADLTGAHLSEAHLIGADLTGAHLGGADLSGAHLTGAHLSEADLTGADLTGAHLSGADLSVAHLTGAHLTGAHLGEADLRGADLGEADLRGADLNGANLRGADLNGANLRGANLSGANLIEADLTGAKLREAFLENTALISVDLSSVDGLEEIEHSGASSVGIDTIRLSKGRIPTAFLRGCGLSDLEIEFAKLAALGLDAEQVTDIIYQIHRHYFGDPIQYYSCFISYNNTDQEFARRLHDDLQDSGVRCWFAPEDLKIGDRMRAAIGEQVRLRDKLLVILSENSIRSEWVGHEVEKAFAEEKEQGSLKLFPIRLDDAALKAKDDWAEAIRLQRHIGDFSNWKEKNSYQKAFERLLRDLKAASTSP